MVYILGVTLFIVLTSIRQINEYERGILFTCGKFTKLLKPGWRIVCPIFQTYQKVDIRTKAVDVPEQEAITRDNVSIKINAVIYYKVLDAGKTVIQVQNVHYAVSQLAQASMRNIVSSVTLDELLTKREKVSKEICKVIELSTDAWGIEVEKVELKDISLPEEMKRILAKAAEAEREKTAIITKSIGEAEAADHLAKAANVLSKNSGSLNLRTLTTLDAISSNPSNTIVYALPIELLKTLEGVGTTKKDK